MRGCFVTGTDTGVGKTFVACAIVAALRHAGVRVAPFKPVVTGVAEPDPVWPMDHVMLAGMGGVSPETVAPHRFPEPVSPHLAAELAGTAIDPAQLATAARAAAENAEVLVVEGVGGLLVPLTADTSIRDLARELALPMVVAARPGLGTINHTLLTIEAARAAGLDVRAVVLSGWPTDPTPMEQSNRATIARLGDIEVATLPVIDHPDPARFTAAGATLPYDRWLT